MYITTLTKVTSPNTPSSQTPGRIASTKDLVKLPGGGAVAIQHVEVLAREQLAPVHPWLNSSQPPQNAHLLHIADQRHDIQPLELRINGVQTAD